MDHLSHNPTKTDLLKAGVLVVMSLALIIIGYTNGKSQTSIKAHASTCEESCSDAYNNCVNSGSCQSQKDALQTCQSNGGTCTSLEEALLTCQQAASQVDCGQNYNNCTANCPSTFDCSTCSYGCNSDSTACKSKQDSCVDNGGHWCTECSSCAVNGTSCSDICKNLTPAEQCQNSGGTWCGSCNKCLTSTDNRTCESACSMSSSSIGSGCTPNCANDQVCRYDSNKGQYYCVTPTFDCSKCGTNGINGQYGCNSDQTACRTTAYCAALCPQPACGTTTCDGAYSCGGSASDLVCSGSQPCTEEQQIACNNEHKVAYPNTVGGSCCGGFIQCSGTQYGQCPTGKMCVKQPTATYSSSITYTCIDESNSCNSFTNEGCGLGSICIASFDTSTNNIVTQCKPTITQITCENALPADDFTNNRCYTCDLVRTLDGATTYEQRQIECPPVVTPSPKDPCRFIPQGDANCNGVLGLDDKDTTDQYSDLDIWRGEYTGNLDAGKKSDFNGDGKVDLDDYEIWRVNALNGSASCTMSDTVEMAQKHNAVEPSQLSSSSQRIRISSSSSSQSPVVVPVPPTSSSSKGTSTSSSTSIQVKIPAMLVTNDINKCSTLYAEPQSTSSLNLGDVKGKIGGVMNMSICRTLPLGTDFANFENKINNFNGSDCPAQVLFGINTNVGMGITPTNTAIGAKFSGSIFVPETGNYVLEMPAWQVDDAASIKFAGHTLTQVVTSGHSWRWVDGVGGMDSGDTKIKLDGLQQGFHEYTLYYSNGSGGGGNLALKLYAVDNNGNKLTAGELLDNITTNSRTYTNICSGSSLTPISAPQPPTVSVQIPALNGITSCNQLYEQKMAGTTLYADTVGSTGALSMPICRVLPLSGYNGFTDQINNQTGATCAPGVNLSLNTGTRDGLIPTGSQIGSKFTGSIFVPETGNYVLEMPAWQVDDAAQIEFAKHTLTQVVQNGHSWRWLDGQGGMDTGESKINLNGLEKGYHPLTLYYSNGGGGQGYLNIKLYKLDSNNVIVSNSDIFSKFSNICSGTNTIKTDAPPISSYKTPALLATNNSIDCNKLVPDTQSPNIGYTIDPSIGSIGMMNMSACRYLPLSSYSNYEQKIDDNSTPICKIAVGFMPNYNNSDTLDTVGIKYTGSVFIPKRGNYRMFIQSSLVDDAATILIDGNYAAVTTGQDCFFGFCSKHIYNFATAANANIADSDNANVIIQDMEPGFHPYTIYYSNGGGGNSHAELGLLEVDSAGNNVGSNLFNWQSAQGFENLCTGSKLR